jgi:uncharacterized protein (DUF58 family)
MPLQPPPLPQNARKRTPARVPAGLPPLDMRLLADLPSLPLQARCLVEGFLSGRHRSPHRGSSVEFAEYRNYQQGDDLRRVDWRLFGRSDRLQLKQYEEETQLRLFLVLDTSASMDYRSRLDIMRKIEFARLALAALAMLAHRQSDAFGLALAGADLGDFLRARSSIPHWRTFIGKLESVSPGGTTDLPRALEALADLLPARSLVVIASDFYEDLEPLRRVLQRFRYDHHDLIGMHILDPQEIDFDLDASGIFFEPEGGARMKLDAPSIRAGYLKRFNAFCKDLDELFHNAGGEAVRLRTDRLPFDALARYLAARDQRL